MSALPLWAVASFVRNTIDPADLTGEVVHYSIPALEETGRPAREAARAIKSLKLKLSGDEVLISRLNPRKARIALVEDDKSPVLASTEFIALRARSCDRHFLYYFLRSTAVRQRLEAEVQSATRSHQRVDADLVMRCAFPSISLHAQQLVAQFLGQQVDLLDRAIALRKIQRDQIVDRGNMRVTSALTNPHLPGDCPRMDFPWLREDGASFVKLAWVADLQSGLTIDAQREGSVEYPYLSVANVQSDRLDLAVVKTVKLDPSVAARFILRSGDVLVTEGGDLDKLGRGTVWRGEIDPCLHQNHVFALRPHPDRLLPEYLAALTRTHHARRYFEMTGSRSTNLASTNSSKVLGFRFPLPDVTRQQRILDELQAAEQDDAVLDAALARQIALLQERKQALITAAVTGQFDVTTARKVSTT